MKKRNIISIAILALLCVSCSNYLDIKPYGRTIPKTAEEFSALIHTRLNSIDAGSDSYLVGNANQWMTWDAVCGDNFETCLTGSGARRSVRNALKRPPPKGENPTKPKRGEKRRR